MRSLLTFFSLTYIVSWTFWAAAAAIAGGTASSGLAGLSGPLLLIGVFAPSLVSLALTAHADGRAGVLALLRPSRLVSVSHAVGL